MIDNDGFLWGAATSSHQVEGQNQNNDWWDWEREHSHRIRDGRGAEDAAQWWNGGAEIDLKTAATELGHGAHRLSLEWSRLEPRPGEFDDKAFERYGEILDFARGLGLRLYVTLNHFTLPSWLGERGWLNPEVPALFARYSARVVSAFHSLVDLWGTINEPAVLTLKAYATKAWPPARGNSNDAAIALKQQLLGHAAAYHAVKKLNVGANIGIVLNLPRFDPANPSSQLDLRSAAAQRWFSSGAIQHALATGYCMPPVGLRPRFHPELRGSLDHMGVNYYGRYLVRFHARSPRMLFGRHVQTNSVRTESSDWGEPSAAGMVEELRLAHELLRVPLYVTENGVYDADDSHRPQFIRDHIAALEGGRRAGIDIRGYFHWSLIDNFEWAQGWTTPFGLIELDPKTQTRRVRPSAHVLRDLIVKRGGDADAHARIIMPGSPEFTTD